MDFSEIFATGRDSSKLYFEVTVFSVSHVVPKIKAKVCDFTLCSIFSNGGHVFSLIVFKITNYNLDALGTNSVKFCHV